MNSHCPRSAPRTSTAVILAVGWVLLSAKCVWVVWAIGRWDIPLAPGWIVVPTLAAGLLATGLWLGKRN
jgi:hypothetical protein